MTELKIYRNRPDSTLPKFSTEQAACFDLAAYCKSPLVYKGYDEYNAPFSREVSRDRIVVMPCERLLVPTGLIFDIPEGYSVRIHARSGLSLKNGIVLANSEAVIDSDYVEETMVMVTNISGNAFYINHGDRIAQAELVPQLKYEIIQSRDVPLKRGNRDGGLGSTGVSEVAEEKRTRGRPKKDVTNAEET
jgi:dUTP pyrophosphatase